jgi:hypothetical protein
MRFKNLIPIMLFSAAVSQAGILYSNTSTDTGFTDSFIQNSLVEAGDQIQLTSAGLVSSASTALYNSGSAGEALSVTLRFYNVDALENLGSEITSSTLTNVSFSAGSLTPLTFSDLNTTLPQNVVWTLSYTTSDPIALELPDYDPPTVGSSDNTTVWWDTGSGLQLTTPGFDTENYYLELDSTDTPEPAGFVLSGAGLLLVCLGWRRKKH